MRRLTAGEIAAVAAELGALPVRWPAGPPGPAGPAGTTGGADPTGDAGRDDPAGSTEPPDPTGSPGAARTGADPAGGAGRAARHPAGGADPRLHDPGAAADPASLAGAAPADADGPTGAGDVADPVAAVAAAQQADSLAGAVASLLVAIVWGRPFDRRNAAVGVAAADLLARLNGHVLVLEPADGTMALVGRVRAGLPVAAVRDWLTGRLMPDLGPQAPPPVTATAPMAARAPLVVRRPHDAPVPPSGAPARARCPWCAMPLRESLTALVLPAGGGTTLAACGGCGRLLARPHQEV